MSQTDTAKPIKQVVDEQYLDFFEMTQTPTVAALLTIACRIESLKRALQCTIKWQVHQQDPDL